jgi:hypothetical protein
MAVCDRIATSFRASKKKGLWVGGVVPLGYEVKDRKLMVNEEEAATVRLISRVISTWGRCRRCSGTCVSRESSVENEHFPQSGQSAAGLSSMGHWPYVT